MPRNNSTKPSSPAPKSPGEREKPQRARSCTPLFYPDDPSIPPTFWQRVKSSVATAILYYCVIIPTVWVTNFTSRWTTKRYRTRQEKRCETVLQATEDSRTWVTTAMQLDRLRDFERWRVSLPTTERYCDPEGMIQEIGFIKSLIQSRNYRAMGEYIRTHLHRNAHGCTAPELFRYYTGTKQCAEAYYGAVKRLLEVFVEERQVFSKELSQHDISSLLDQHGEALDPEGFATGSKSAYTQGILEWARENPDRSHLTTLEKFHLLRETAQSFGRTALLLSGGASLGMYHIGVVRALWNEGLLPAIISGSSAGAIIASIFCTRSDTAIDEMMSSDIMKVSDLTFSAFELIEDAEHNINVKIRRLLNSGAFMDVNHLMAMLKENCGDLTFLEAYRLTGRILNVSVAADREGEKAMQLNYINTPNLYVWSGVSASCCMPGLFTAVALYQKDPRTGKTVPFLEGQLWFDGSVAADLPKKQLSELFNCNCFVVSQTNPHVIPFLKSNVLPTVHKKAKSSLLKRLWFRGGREVYYWMIKLWKADILPKTGGAEIAYLLANQCYEGDVTIYPIGSVWNAIPDYINITTNPSEEYISHVTSQGMRRTWPYTNQIRCLMEVEQTLYSELRRLNQQLILQGKRPQGRRRNSFSLGVSMDEAKK